MPITVRKSKPRKIKTTKEAKQRRLDYKKAMKNPAAKKAASKKAAIYYKKNKGALKRKAAMNRK